MASNSKVGKAEREAIRRKRPFGFTDKFGYALGDFACGLSFTFISTYMFIFYTQYVGISLVHFGVIILLTKIWDAINDPIIGALVDKLSPKNGDKFRPWIFWGSFPLVFSAALLFIDSSSLAYSMRIVACIVFYLIWDISYTVVNVPYGSLNSVITANSIERSQLSTWRSIGSAVAVLPIQIIMPQFIYKKEVIGGKEVSVLLGDKLFMWALGLGFVALICFQIMHRFTVERIKPKADIKQEKYNYFVALKGFFTSRSMLAVALGSFANIVLMQSTQSTNALVFQMYFGDGSLASYSVLIMAVPMLIGIPLIKPLVKRFGKKNLVTWPLILSMVAYLALLIPREMSPTYFIVMNTLAYVGNGAQMLLIWAMVADAIDAVEYKTGRRDEGSMYAMYSLTRKLAQGVGQALIPFTFAFFIKGLDMSNEATWSMGNSGLVVKNISMALPLIGTVVTFFCFLFLYDLTKTKIAKIQKELGHEQINEEVEIDISVISVGHDD